MGIFDRNRPKSGTIESWVQPVDIKKTPHPKKRKKG